MKTQESNDDLFLALEACLHLLGQKSRQQAEAGACVFISNDGRRLCVRLSQEDCEKIPGLRYIGGPCHETFNNIQSSANGASRKSGEE